MELSDFRKKEKKARDIIISALKQYHGNSKELVVPKFTAERIPSDQYHAEISKEGIGEGLECFRLINNMSGLSGGEFDLTSLLEHYILNVDSRNAINQILKERRGY